MARASTVRRRIADVSRRLLALLDESVAPPTAVGILVAEKCLPPRVDTDPALPLSSALAGVLPGPGPLRDTMASVFEYVRTCEMKGRGDLALRLLGQPQIQRAHGRTSLGIIGLEFVVLGIVLAVHSIFVLPQLKATFDAVGTPLPPFTRVVFALIGPAGPFLPAGILVLLILVAWRKSPSILGPLIRPIDRALLALPLVGRALRRNNSDRLSGWLGSSDGEASSQRIAIEAVQAWYRGDLLSRQCTGALRECDAGKEIPASFVQSRGFDDEFRGAISLPDREDSLAALRARWRLSTTQPERPMGMEPAVVQVVLGVIVAAVVIAMYLPIFKLGSLM